MTGSYVAWLPIASLVIGGIVRGLKENGKLPWNVSPRLRPWVAIGLGLVVAAIDKVAAGASWRDAGMVALSGGVAIVMHELGIESVRSGVELPILEATKDPS